MTSINSNFHRTQSKVWWGNVDEHDPYRFLSLPKIKESTSINSSDRSTNSSTNGIESEWDHRRGSPGSLKSQDSGFADSDHSHNSISNSKPSSAQSSPDFFENQLKNYSRSSPNKLTPKKCINNEINREICLRSPSVSSEQITPPTVIRKKINSEAENCSLKGRRISFSAPNSPSTRRSSSPDLIKKIDSLNFNTTSPLSSSISINSSGSQSPQMEYKFVRDRSIRRGSKLSRSKRVNKRIIQDIDENSDTSLGNMGDDIDKSSTSINDPKSILKSPRPYNNETVYFGYGYEEDSNNNVTSKSSTSEKQRLPTYDELFPKETSTPKNNQQLHRKSIYYRSTSEPENSFDSDDFTDLSATMKWDTFTYIEYSNPALNGHSGSVQCWLDEMRSSYCHEVLSTLQTKSVAQEAIRNANLGSVTTGKVIQQLQDKVIQLQDHFEIVEKLINTNLDNLDTMAISKIMGLFEAVVEFVNKIRQRNIFQAQTERDVKRFEDNMSSIIDLAMDLHKNVTSQPIDIEPKELLEDVLVIKRYLLITIQLIFEKLIQIVVDKIEDTKCDLILRSNITMISMLSNIEYNGFASLNDAFRSTGIIKALLTVCVESKHSSLRALSLRALATICSTKELIRQFEQIDGIDIIKDVLTEQYMVRMEPELREAVSVLTQVTAPWHGRLHAIEGIRNCTESFVESITKLLDSTECCQTLLLCAACLNNLSKMEVTTAYSIMSNETILKLRKACENRGPGASIFLYEQVSSILLNMASVKKCHSHLANKDIITFITQIFQTQFYGKYDAKTENDAHHRTIKNVLYIFSRLIHESVVGQDILENNVVPIFSKIELNSGEHSINKCFHSADISNIVKKLNESVSHRSMSRFGETEKLDEKKLLESYV